MKKMVCLSLVLLLVLMSFAALAKELTVKDIRAMSAKELSDLLASYLRQDGKNFGKPLPKALKEHFASYGTATNDNAPPREAEEDYY